MCIHQNHHRRTVTSYVPEVFLPLFLNFVFWGHEHECKPRIEPITPADDDKFGRRARGARDSYVIQPGSTVATALSEGAGATGSWGRPQPRERGKEVVLAAGGSDAACNQAPSSPQSKHTDDSHLILTPKTSTPNKTQRNTSPNDKRRVQEEARDPAGDCEGSLAHHRGGAQDSAVGWGLAVFFRIWGTF